MARKRSVLFPLAMLAIGLAAGWWLARHGLPMSRPGVDPAAPAVGAGDIRVIDFRNFRYQPDCLRSEDGTGESIEVHDGGFQRLGEFERVDFSVLKLLYGDLTGDGRDEAVVLTHCSTGGSGQFTEGFVYSLQTGQLAEIGRVESGSKAFGGIAELRIEGGMLRVERYATDEDGAHCCPKYIDTTRLRWDGARLVPDGSQSRRPMPAE